MAADPSDPPITAVRSGCLQWVEAEPKAPPSADLAAIRLP
jgi:hypothetical protein